MPTCLPATPVVATCLTAVQLTLPPVLELFLLVDDIETPVARDEILSLSPGDYTFLIRNTGEAVLYLSSLSLALNEDEDMSISQPLQNALSANETTTFTLTVVSGSTPPPPPPAP